MALLIDWSPQALEDLELIAEYIARDSDFYARAVVQALLEGARSLGTLPNRGRIVPEFGDPCIRERLLYSYRLIYRIETERIVIVAVIHGQRLLTNVEKP
ncbi:MAG: type II toxin-antitoxin system RelE/ParE family toxin [Desulfomicrobium sp.]|nr:type II toxin-antitoxin system RelE/ParE family toxin [Pseudomonadota bacterium]MBV1710668.1 type II toxin-antitoxin system RelE/ParE family toxin [Desulfomicrobium sp.]MBU4570276.1 type II toxin-antitoxin system RelE/ParE family toxin [Pseudomonadota bacterium]MBU4593196.1 type II toxin-antitoxin system RelE/ParE family toxin [Pseudomonadota bacterium]MBV1720320.1 type II toxin-antitoxin system RelE/ParE family toxin [Desulfomicrobium sp.]